MLKHSTDLVLFMFIVSAHAITMCVYADLGRLSENNFLVVQYIFVSY